MHLYTKLFKRLSILILSLTLLILPACNTQITTPTKQEAGLSTAHPLATDGGMKILKQGGNAFDAAITVTAILAVVEPYSSGIGGGGFWLLHDAKHNKDIMLDGRETAPERSTATMYLDKKNNVIPELSITGALAAGIPGEPAAIAWLAENKGNLPLSITLKPAIDLARNGFAVDAYYLKMLAYRINAIRKSPDASKAFLINNETPALGSLIKQPDLAHTLELLAAKGHAGFYQGETAQKLVAGVQAANGIWTMNDLKNYQIKLRKPVKAHYKGMTITSASLPSSGGIVLAEIFNILSAYDFQKLNKTDQTHLMIEAMKRAYRDRAEYMGDSDFVTVPVQTLLGKKHSKQLQQSIRMDKATPSKNLPPTWHDDSAGTDTTHFSILDKDGNRVAATLSINYPFGSCFIPKGTGVLLNDEMDDFSSKPGEPNVYGLVGAKANAIEPGKRMLSSMSPTFLETKDRLAIIGTPGGSRIITMVMLGSMAFYEGKTADEIVNLPRYHHQYLPDNVQYEPNALDKPTVEKLGKRGHIITPNDSTWGIMHIVIQDKKTGKVSAAADKRVIGTAATSPQLKSTSN